MSLRGVSVVQNAPLSNAALSKITHPERKPAARRKSVAPAGKYSILSNFAQQAAPDPISISPAPRVLQPSVGPDPGPPPSTATPDPGPPCPAHA
jgi:hypothetical protein